MSLAAQTDAPAFDEATLRKRFPDDKLPRLLADAQTAKGQRAAKSLGKLGSRAHEAVLGTLRASTTVLPGHFVDAFTDLDAAAAWAVPLLVDCVRQHSPNSGLAVELLAGFERTPRRTREALQQLLTRGGTPPDVRDRLQRLVENWRARDLAPGRPAAPGRDGVPATWTAPLLELLATGRANVAWPALQALLAGGDDATFEAALVLVVQLRNRAKAAQARQLLDVLHATYRARYGPDPSGPFQAPPSVREAAIRGYLMADHHPQARMNWESELRIGSAERRRTLALAAALRSARGADDPFVQFVLAHPDQIPPLDVRPQLETGAMIALPARARAADRLDSADVIKVLHELDNGTPQEQMMARSKLASAEVDELSGKAVEAVLAAWQRHGPTIDSFVRQHLHRGGAAAVRPVHDAFRTTDDQQRRATLLSVLGHIRPMRPELLRTVFLAIRDDDLLRGAGTSGLRRDKDASVLDSTMVLLEDGELRPLVVRELWTLLPDGDDAEGARDQLTTLLDAPYLDDQQRANVLSLLTRAPREGLEMLHDMMRSDDARRRAAAVRAYGWRRGDSRWTDTVLAMLGDPDPTVRVAAATVCGGAVRDRERVVEAMVALWPDASLELQEVMVRAFVSLAPESGAAAALLEPRLTAPGWGARLAAAGAVLAADNSHAAAREVFAALLRDPDGYTRRAALSALQRLPYVAERFGDEVGKALDDPDQQVVLEALYVGKAAPKALFARRGRIAQLAESEQPNVAFWANQVIDAMAAIR